MITHRYIGAGAFYQGLPAADLDYATLTDDQQALLAVAVAHGLYEGVAEVTDHEQPESPNPTAAAQEIEEDNGAESPSDRSVALRRSKANRP